MSYIKHKADESVEDYLEAILMLRNRIGKVRSIDVARELNFSKPSVSVAMKNLRNKEYITIDENGFISLTATGEERAKSVLEKHTLLSNWLISIGVTHETALEDACKMEHDLSEESFQAIKKALLEQDIFPE